MKLYQIDMLRKLFIPLLKFFNPGKISIKHHYTKSRFVLDVFKHKGYWFHGKRREIKTMHLFEKLIQRNFLVIEVGGHIGYITNYFSFLLESGYVYVFEPGKNNLPYLKENIASCKNVKLIEKAVSDKIGEAKFYIENLSGQNNSLLPDYENAKANEKSAHVKMIKKEVKVETITLDAFCDELKLMPDFIKIDIEGFELFALKGSINILREYKPIMMIEITENAAEIFTILQGLDYRLFNEECLEYREAKSLNGNIFCFHNYQHKEIILGISNELN